MEDYIDLPPVEKLDNVLTLIATDIRLKNSYFKFDLICEILFEMKPRYKKLFSRRMKMKGC